ncbi:MAG: iron ABC transporter permease [Actinobacteria bacterium]|nr:iron ABC transporter permease [Actinomycetota bacterium]
MSVLTARSEVLLSTGGGRLSVLVDRRSATATGALLGTVVALAVLSTALGTRLLPITDVLAGLAGTADRGVTLTVREFRLPRTVVAVLVGMALGTAGALTQALTRNPLASPDVLGVVNGASAGAVLVLITAGGATAGYGGAAAGLSEVGVPLGAVGGALLSAALVLGIASRRIGALPGTQRVVLVGIILNAVFLGLVQWALTVGDVDQATKAAVWLTGSLHGRGWEHVSAVGITLIVLLPLALLLRRPLEAVALGEDVAAALGIPMRRLRLVLFTVAFALAGTAVAAAGAISFVALLAPLLARRMTRRSAPLLPAALTGAALLLAADVLARYILPGHELPAGAVTALVGAPVLLVLLVRGRT